MTIETLTISRFVYGKIKFETVIDNGPKFDGAGFSVEDRELNYQTRIRILKYK
jgi:hypothetical protein